MTLESDVTGRELLRDDVRRTLVVAGGTVLCFAPMRTVFSDWTWLVQTIGAIICLLGPAVFLRSRRAPRIVQLLPGLVLLVLYVNVVYLRSSSVAGILPGPDTWHALRVMRARAADQIRNNVSPLDSTPVLRLGVVPALALVSGIVDAYAVVRRAPALAGIPLLALFTICGATAGQSVGWVEFSFAAAGFLLILSADGRVNLLSWGRIVPRRNGDEIARPRLGLSGRRVGVAAVIIAVLVPAVMPGLSGNRLAQAFHGSGGGGGGGLSPFATLKGQLTQGKSVPLATVTTTDTGGIDPFYLRDKILSKFTDSGWVSDASPPSTPLGPGTFTPTFGERSSTTSFTAKVTITGLQDTVLPLFARPRAISGLPPGFLANTDDITVGGGTVRRGVQYVEQVVQPDPTPEQLRGSTQSAGSTGAVDPNLLDVPTSLPRLVTTTVQTIIDGVATPYAKAVALTHYFRDGQDGFTYSLSTKAGDSGNDLVDFLNNRTGYCQQYAAAMAIMLRIAGIPSRVVLGYTHSAPNQDGTFTVTSHDAHAWVEAYFAGLGWIPFDPTPLSGGRATTLPYDPRPNVAPATGSADPTRPRVSASRRTEATTSHANAAAASTSRGGGVRVPAGIARVVGAIVAIAVLLSIVPGWRRWRRRARFRAAVRSLRLAPIWDELRDLTVDTGTAWGAATTPRQVPAWLAGLGVTGTHSMTSIARRVERERYAASNTSGPATTDEINDAIDQVTTIGRSLRSRLTPRQRLRASLAPRSLVGGRRSR